MARNEWLKILSKLLLDSEMNVFLEHLLKGKRVKIITGLFICGPCVCYMDGPFYSETEESGLCPPLLGHLPPVHLDKSLGSSAQSQARHQPAFLPLPPSPRNGGRKLNRGNTKGIVRYQGVLFRSES